MAGDGARRAKRTQSVLPLFQRILLCLCAGCVLPCAAQVLARPGWAGSGVAPEAWWRRAVFYRIDPLRFQDSTGDGKGDLQGIVERLDYLQSLGVDALVLDGPVDADSLGELAREASQRHLRVVMALSPAAVAGPREALLRSVHDWLGAGIAGLAMPAAGGAQLAGGSSYASLAGVLRQMLQSLPGERVLLSDPLPAAGAETGARVGRGGRRGEPAPSRGGQLVTAAALPGGSASAGQEREVLADATKDVDPGKNAFLQLAADPATGSPEAAADAAMILASRGAALFDFGDEIGLDLFPQPGKGGHEGEAAALPVMQWTPSNHTPALADRVEESNKSTEPEFGAYHPYQPPPRSLTGGMPAPARVVADANIPVAPPAPDTLPGFTAGTLPTLPVGGADHNVVVQDRDPRSLLNAYRALIGLHHDNAALRNGTQIMLNRDAEGAVVWIRRAPAGSRTMANVVVATNRTGKALTLNLDNDVEALGMRPGTLRPLFSYAAEAMTGESTGRLALPAHAVFVGEIFHAGSPAAAGERGHPGRRGRRRGR